jgi:hypothetical protein
MGYGVRRRYAPFFERLHSCAGPWQNDRSAPDQRAIELGETRIENDWDLNAHCIHLGFIC